MPIKVKIENFQSIKDIEFEINQYTVLTGPSNSGKSAICRAIEGALFNRSGDGFVRNGEKHAQVTLITDTHEIVWTKGSGKNHYSINGEVYDKVGSDVPDSVYNMGFRDIELTRSKLRPQMGTDQFDILFLIREQGSLISEVFSVLGRLDVITNAGKSCSSDLKNKKSLLKTRYEDLTAVDRKLANYQGFEKVELASESLQVDHEEIVEETQNLKHLTEMSQQLHENKQQIKALSGVDKIKVPEDIDSKSITQLKGMIAAFHTLSKLSAEIFSLTGVDTLEVPDFSSDKLLSLVKQLNQVQDNYLHTKKEIALLKEVSILPVPESVSDSDIQLIKDILNQSSRLDSIRDHIENEQEQLEGLVQQIADLEATLHTLLDGLEECPLCNQTLEQSYVH